jgi:hypothetical protein
MRFSALELAYKMGAFLDVTRGGFNSPAALGDNTNCRPPPTTHRRRMRSGVLVGGEVVMGRSK